MPPGRPFTEWLAGVVGRKRATPLLEARRAAQEALARVRATGTTALADILSLDVSDALLREAAGPDFRALLFHELIDFHEESGARRALAAEQTVFARGPLPPAADWGLSPHAPYTTTQPLLRAAAALAAERGRWLCIHAAETSEETRLLLHGDGPLREFLAPVLPPSWTAPGLRPIPWLDAADALGPRTLLVHCNDVTDADLRLIRARGCRVVVCPGAHAYFQRGEFPLRRLLEAGIPTYLGTDSLASNTDLDMAREVALAQELSGLPADVVAPLAAAERAHDFLPSA